MLHKEAVEGDTYQLLKKLMSDEKLNNFNLAGGTALALYLGHRLSIDLDLFARSDFNANELEEYLIDKYNFQGAFLKKNTLKGQINGIKIDCITHNYDNIYKPYIYESVRLYSINDIAAMKLRVISDDGTRLKDFVDVAFLSTKISFNQMLDFYEKKYPNTNRMRPLKSLNYFDDIINIKEPLQLINGTYDWRLVERRLQNMVKYPDRIFVSYPMNINREFENAFGE
ncbi:MAG: nucleotidyl transferase AbiEii/AbiGii toxin family protein [Prevotella sp.]|jgi:predicted nucleotidyltransferase component of viral defense system|nr:nucleotidyl transferase AbiEii/AbiGii toxin family protein [Prevotella sp.]